VRVHAQFIAVSLVLTVAACWRKVSSAPDGSLSPELAAVPSKRLLDEMSAQTLSSSFIAGPWAQARGPACAARMCGKLRCALSM
jgi:hypothetical protein